MAQKKELKCDYAALHIKHETRDRLNLVRAEFSQRRKQFTTQDELINLLIDHTDVSTLCAESQVA